MSDLISRQAVIDTIETDCSWDIFNEWGSRTPTGECIINAIKSVPSVEPKKCGDCISRQAAEEKLKKVVDEMALIFADIREKNVDDSVCGLCEYDCDHGIDGYANECPGFERDDCFKLKEEYQKEWTDLSNIPSVEPERKMGHCNGCKYFEYDSVAKVGGIPLIVAHEICKRWGDGCKTSEDGYCFLYAPREREDKE